MISRISGKLIELLEDTATLQVGGICYNLFVPSGMIESLKSYLKSETSITLHTIYYIEAGDMKSAHYPRLIGFTDPVDMEFFQLLISVPGLGVKKALKSLILPISEIARDIEEKNPAGLSRLPGVGPRLAEKIVASLAGKTAKYALAQGGKPLALEGRAGRGTISDEALDVLLQLQYNRAEATEMIRLALVESPQVKTSDKLIALVFASQKSPA